MEKYMYPKEKKISVQEGFNNDFMAGVKIRGEWGPIHYECKV